MGLIRFFSVWFIFPVWFFSFKLTKPNRTEYFLKYSNQFFYSLIFSVNLFYLIDFLIFLPILISYISFVSGSSVGVA
jgi:hypothetical protein